MMADFICSRCDGPIENSWDMWQGQRHHEYWMDCLKCLKSQIAEQKRLVRAHQLQICSMVMAASDMSSTALDAGATAELRQK
jgi:hypothetical protein